PAALRDTIEALAAGHEGSRPRAVAGIESRGFIFGTAVAERLGVGFVPIRKPGKLPAATIAASYSLEYGTDSLEIHRDAFAKGSDVLIVDDLLATGGTAKAAAELVQKLGGRIAGVSFVIELLALEGRKRLEGLPVSTLVRY
ncbi:MAG TPA: adenine phosphoribosyltransferase, partial [Candidatus Saccharimonadales bacterium]|nr:adenine phosphoribosyltransferase [Candidatus Saccharimonadales bacterium]